MDMKRILQAMDGVATKPVAGANDMSKFLSIVKHNDVEILNEGANPHKVSLPVQMAMQHYQQPSQIEKKKFTDTGIRKFFHDVEQEVAEEKTTKQQLLKQYSQTIAERVLMREFKEHDKKLDPNKLSVKAHRFLQQAHQMSPGDEGDIEAMAAAASELADTAKQQQHTIDRQMDMYTQLQDLLSGTEERFRDLNAKVASGEITQQDAAVAAQEIEREHDHERGEIAKQHKHHIEPEKLKHVEKPIASTQLAPASQPPITQKTSTTKAIKSRSPAPASVTSAPVSRAVPSMPTTAPEPAAVNPLAHMANQILGKHHVPDVTGNRTVYRTREKPQEPRKSYGVNPGTTASYNYSAGIPSPNGTYSYPQTAPATAPAQTTPSKTTGEKKVHDLIKRTANLPVDQLADVFESLYEEHDLEHPKGPHVPPTDFQPTEPEPVEPVQNQQPAPQENNDVTTNAATIKTAFKKFEPVADIYFGGRGVTVYASQMYALSMTLINIKDPSKREHRKNHILGTYQGWLEFIQSNRTRQWVGHYTNWYKDQLKKQKQQARSVGQQSLPLHEVRILALNVVAVKEGYPNWEEAQKLLDKAEFNKLIEKAAVLSERYHTDQLSQAKVLSTGPGPQENQLDSDGRAMLGLEETPSTMDRMKRYRMMRRISKKAGIDLSDLEHATDDELHQLYQQHSLKESPIYDQPDRDVHNPDVAFNKANTHPLETVINMANHDILRLADDVNNMKTMSLEGKLLVWQRMAQEFTTGGVMQTLAGRAAQIAHGIEELKRARQTGKGIAPKRRHGISKNLE